MRAGAPTGARRADCRGERTTPPTARSARSCRIRLELIPAPAGARGVRLAGLALIAADVAIDCAGTWSAARCPVGLAGRVEQAADRGGFDELVIDFTAARVCRTCTVMDRSSSIARVLGSIWSGWSIPRDSTTVVAPYARSASTSAGWTPGTCGGASDPRWVCHGYVSLAGPGHSHDLHGKMDPRGQPYDWRRS
jgi:hypothetical protein